MAGATGGDGGVTGGAGGFGGKGGASAQRQMTFEEHLPVALVRK